MLSCVISVLCLASGTRMTQKIQVKTNYTDAISFCENFKLVQHGITESNLKLLRIFVKIRYNYHKIKLNLLRLRIS